MLTPKLCIRALRQDRDISADIRAEIIRRIERQDILEADLDRLARTHEWFAAILAEEFRRHRKR